MKKIILIGSGQHCDVVIYNIEAQNKYKVACIADIDKDKSNTKINGILIEPFVNLNEESLNRLKEKYNTDLFFISFGTMKYRKSVYDYIISQGWKAVNIIHPDAVVSAKTVIGNGVLIEAGCLVTPNPIIGNNVVINTGSQVNHDNVVEDNVYIASGVILSGGVLVGNNTLLDDGVIITLGKKVGENCIIGAGAVVTKDIPDNSIAYGSPCKVIKENIL